MLTIRRSLLTPVVLPLTRILLNLLARDQKYARLTHKLINYAETVVLSWPDLTPGSLEIDLMAGWMLTTSFVPPLRIRRDGTTLKLASNPHQQSILPTFRTIRWLVAPANQTVTAILGGLSTASAILTVCLATITTATVPTVSHASSRAVSVFTSAGPCEPIMTVFSTSGSVAGNIVKETFNKIKSDQAFKSEIATVVCEVNATANSRPTAAESQFGESVVCLQCGLEGHYRKDCHANSQGN